MMTWLRRQYPALAILCLLSLLAVSILPAHGQSPKASADVQHVVLDKHVEANLEGYTADGATIWRAKIHGAPKYLDNLQTPIEARWHYDGDSKYSSLPNLFDVSVDGNKVTVEVPLETRTSVMSWNPDVSIGGTEHDLGYPMIEADWIDPDYYDANIIAWDGIEDVSRKLRITEGHIAEYYKVSAVLSGNLLIEPHLSMDSDFTFYREPAAWDADYNRVPIEYDSISHAITLTTGAMQDAALPITIDPDATFTSTTNDGYLVGSSRDQTSMSAAWSEAHDATTVDSSWDLDDSSNYLIPAVAALYRDTTGEYWVDIQRVFVFFDTSSLPTNTAIDEATLTLDVESADTGVGWWDLQVQQGGATYPHEPLQSGDYDYTSYSGSGGTLSAGSTGKQSITLDSDGRSWIDASGTTHFVLREAEHDIADSYWTPGTNWEANSMRFYSAEAGSSVAPTLEVLYHVQVDEPTVTTNDATDVAMTSAKLWGYLSDDGGEPCTVRFEYGTTTDYGSYTAQQPSVESGTDFSDVPSDLSRGTLYHFRARAANSNSTATGADKTFLTHPNRPTSLSITSGEDYNTLSWTKGAGANQTYAYYSTDTYPQVTVTGTAGSEMVESDGTEIYTGTSATYNHTALVSGTTYYYTLVSRVDDGGYTRYSTSAVQDYSTPEALTTPSVRTDYATSIGNTTATLNGYLEDMGNYDSCNVSFDYYADGGAAWGESTSNITKSSEGSYSDDLTGLANATMYHYRATATNSAGTTEGFSVSFTTGGEAAPAMTTLSERDVTMNEATLRGEVTSDGGSDVSAWFEYGTTEDCNDGSSPTEHGLLTGDTLVWTASGLSESTTYYYRIVGENDVGTAYADAGNLTTAGPTKPSVATGAAQGVGSTSATVYGNLTSDGGEDCEVRFAWGSTSDCPQTTGWKSGYSTNDTFEAILSDLDTDKTYYYKAQAQNGGGVSSGGTKEFTTVFGAPDRFEATAVSSSAVELEWLARGEQTKIVYKTSSYPVTRDDGASLYFGTDESYLHSGLSPGVTHYYSAWSLDTNGNWSNAHAESSATTSGPGARERDPDDVITPPSWPDRLMGPPEYSHLANVPFYGAINGVADYYGMPNAWAWFAVAVILAIVGGVLAGYYTHSTLGGSITTALLLFVGWWLWLVPLVFVLLSIFITVGIAAHRGEPVGGM